MISDKQREQIVAVIRKFPAIKLAYLFGSQATGDTGSMSDYDFAIYIEPKELKQSYADESASVSMGHIQFSLIGRLCHALRTNAVDVVLLNDPGSSELKYAVISEGILLHEVEPYQILVEPIILNDYFDFRAGLRQYGLTKT